MYRAARPLLFRLDPERAHRLVFGTLAALGPVARTLSSWAAGAPDPRLELEIAGLRFPSPIGLAAGLDKDGTLARFWHGLGFGFVELGTVTALPQPGNERPRLFRFPEQEALVNRMGFNNAGSEALAARLRRLRDAGWVPRGPIGANIGKSKVTPLEDAVSDYATSARRLAGCCDYMVVNVSSPNTPGLRSLQSSDQLARILDAVRAEVGALPVFAKLAPDLEDEAVVDAARVVTAAGAAGVIATNTTIQRHGLPEVGPGGLSGRPLLPRALEVVRLLASACELPIIGVGGVASAEDALAMLGAGASAVQVYSALIFQGPGLVRGLNQGLSAALDAHDVQSIPALAAALRS